MDNRIQVTRKLEFLTCFVVAMQCPRNSVGSGFHSLGFRVFFLGIEGSEFRSLANWPILEA